MLYNTEVHKPLSRRAYVIRFVPMAALALAALPLHLPTTAPVMAVLLHVLFTLVLLPSIIARLNDMGFSSWWSLVAFLPVVSLGLHGLLLVLPSARAAVPKVHA